MRNKKKSNFAENLKKVKLFCSKIILTILAAITCACMDFSLGQDVVTKGNDYLIIEGTKKCHVNDTNPNRDNTSSKKFDACYIQDQEGMDKFVYTKKVSFVIFMDNSSCSINNTSTKNPVSDEYIFKVQKINHTPLFEVLRT